MYKTNIINGIKLFTLFCGISLNASNTERENQLINHVKWALDQAQNGNSKLSNSVMAIPGMTSPKVKHFLNNICSLKGVNYLEIGVWKGATFTAALYQNHNTLKKAVAIDNWSEFEGSLDEFQHNCSCIKNVPYEFYSHDAFTIDINKLFDTPVDIYFYDGNHTALSQELAFTYYDSLFASTFIAIVDDWNHPPVSRGTFEAFKKLNYEILYEQTLPALFNGDTTQWWNGLYVAVIRRK